MKKEQLINEVSKNANLTKENARKVIEVFMDAVSNCLKKGEALQLMGFGTFSITDRKARSGLHPRTGEEITIPAKKVPKFSPGKSLKEAAAS